MADEIVERLARIETHLESLVGNGQPGLITKMQDDIKALRESRAWLIGFIAAFEFAGHWLGHKLGIK